MLGKFQSCPSLNHWQSMKSVIRYLIGTRNHGILLPNDFRDIKLSCWSDADWARDCTKRRSRTGYILMINNGPTVWASRLQSSTAQSSTEAEFFSLAACVREIVWVRSLLTDLRLSPTQPTRLFQDNLGAISWTSDLQGLRKFKNVGVRYPFERHHVDNKIIHVQYCPSG